MEPSKIKRVIFCSGKVYYDLLQARYYHRTSADDKTPIGTLHPVSIAVPFKLDSCRAGGRFGSN